jgi:hypothetical protein
MISRRKFISFLSTTSALAGCGLLNVDPWHPLLRSDVLLSPEDIARVTGRAKVRTLPNSNIRVLCLKGTPYEVGFQQGAIIRDVVNESLMSMYDNVLDVYMSPEFFAESYERLRPHIPQSYVDEMHGLAHGSKLPLNVIHALHALPEMSEWGGKKHIKGLVKQMIAGELATTCSNIGALRASTRDGKMLAVRILDWGLYKISRLHEFPQITVVKPQSENPADSSNGNIPYANIGWSGFLGAVSGMNEAGITLGEMGYGDPEGETLRGVPMIFLLREVLAKAENLNDVRKILKSAKGNNSYVFLMTDGKNNEAAMFIKDRNRLLEFKPGETVQDGNEKLPGIKNIVYGGHYNERMSTQLPIYNSKITPQNLMKDLIPTFAMPSNFHNVIYAPEDLQLWVANAASEDEPAYTQRYAFFDLKKELSSF